MLNYHLSQTVQTECSIHVLLCYKGIYTLSNSLISNCICGQCGHFMTQYIYGVKKYHKKACKTLTI